MKLMLYLFSIFCFLSYFHETDAMLLYHFHSGDNNDGAINNWDNIILLVIFLYGESSFPTRLGMDSSLIGVKNQICDHWSNLTPFSIEISYQLEGKVIIVDTDSDLHSILCYQIYKNSDYFVFMVKSKTCELECDVLSIGSGCNRQSNSFCSGSLSGELSVDSSCYLKDILKKGSEKTLFDFLGFRFDGAEGFREFLMAYQIKNGYD